MRLAVPVGAAGARDADRLHQFSELLDEEDPGAGVGREHQACELPGDPLDLVEVLGLQERVPARLAQTLRQVAACRDQRVYTAHVTGLDQDLDHDVHQEAAHGRELGDEQALDPGILQDVEGLQVPGVADVVDDRRATTRREQRMRQLVEVGAGHGGQRLVGEVVEASAVEHDAVARGPGGCGTDASVSGDGDGAPGDDAVGGLVDRADRGGALDVGRLLRQCVLLLTVGEFLGLLEFGVGLVSGHAWHSWFLKMGGVMTAERRGP